MRANHQICKSVLRQGRCYNIYKTVFTPFGNLHVILIWTWQMFQGANAHKGRRLNDFISKKLNV